MKRLIAPLSSLILVVYAAHAEWLDEATIKAAAEAFPARDSIGSIVLKGRSVSGVCPRGRLWIAALTPSGHIVMSGSDLADPIVGFSRIDFAEPDPESPACAVLDGANASIEALEAGGGTRHARWARLFGAGTRGKGQTTAATPSAETIVIEPFLDTHYNQCQPYNDYAPVYNPDIDQNAYRGRCPCGCVATAAAQMLKHFQWPARVDKTLSFNHEFFDENDICRSYAIRFDGHLPFDWDSIDTNYVDYAWSDWMPVPDKPGYIYKTPVYDLRGTVAEAVRHPIARLVHFCDVLANMSFAPDGSASIYDDVAQNLRDWYTDGRWIEVEEGADYSPVVEDLRAGVPLQVGIDVGGGGHQVVAHGWADDGEGKFIYLNFGWGGNNDGYYNVNGELDVSIDEIFTGHRPRAKAQLDPLPKVCGANPTLGWHFPDFHAGSLSGFAVDVRKLAAEPSTFLDDFSASTGMPENGMCVTNAVYDYWDEILFSGDNVLYARAHSSASWTFSEKVELTSASCLSFRLRSYLALGTLLEIQARFDGGEWETLATPGLCTGTDSGWTEERMDLGEFCGRIAQFRVKTSAQGYSFYRNGCVAVDDFQLSGILELEEPERHSVGAADRACTLTGLDVGAKYVFTVTPIVSGATGAGEQSEHVAVRIADAAPATPEITAVSHSRSAVVDGLFAECSMGGNVFSVTCTPSVVSLEAHASAATLVPDSAIRVYSLGGGRFVVTVDGSGIPAYAERTRTILTLAAADANGTAAYKDLSLRFSSETEPDEYEYTPPEEIAGNGVSVGDKGVVEESEGGCYIVTANDGETLTAEDFDFGAVSKDAYDVKIAPGGKSATVTLKEPAFGAAEVAPEAAKDPSDASGMLVVVDPGVISAPPEPAAGEAVGALPVKTYPGLRYQAGWGNDLGGFSYGTKVTATGSMLYLGVIRQAGPQGFYRLIVSEK